MAVVEVATDGFAQQLDHRSSVVDRPDVKLVAQCAGHPPGQVDQLLRGRVDVGAGVGVGPPVELPPSRPVVEALLLAGALAADGPIEPVVMIGDGHQRGGEGANAELGPGR